MPSNGRRVFLSNLAAGSTLLYPPAEADALLFIGGPDRRQLELCLATILRTEYWAMNVAKSLQTKLLSSPTPTAASGGESADATATANPTLELTENQRKQPYLEARLGAKALLTQKIGGGANSRVLELGGFQLKECLEDAKYWCGQLAGSNQLPGDASPKTAKRICANDLAAASDDLVESLASLVEFDGLETTQDPSPRTSLTLASYNPQKGKFVYRTLVERVVPSCERFLGVFGKEKMAVVAEYVRRDHGDEVPFEILEQLYAAQSPQT